METTDDTFKEELREIISIATDLRPNSGAVHAAVLDEFGEAAQNLLAALQATDEAIRRHPHADPESDAMTEVFDAEGEAFRRFDAAREVATANLKV